ncbi:MAG: hypothetical protein HYV07_32235 [Deltaproteobacteria bacterium]|nr:hypothetical protein [Deltaproteobacteria bacterium]
MSSRRAFLAGTTVAALAARQASAQPSTKTSTAARLQVAPEDREVVANLEVLGDLELLENLEMLELLNLLEAKE